MINVGIAGLGFMGMIHYHAYQRVSRTGWPRFVKRIPCGAGDWRTIKGNFGPQGTLMDLSRIGRYADLDGCSPTPRSTWSTSACRRMARRGGRGRARRGQARVLREAHRPEARPTPSGWSPPPRVTENCWPSATCSLLPRLQVRLPNHSRRQVRPRAVTSSGSPPIPCG